MPEDGSCELGISMVRLVGAYVRNRQKDQFTYSLS
jgi:hypothetical protein